MPAEPGGGRVAATATLRFALLITGTCGFLDAYTYLERGGVFANAQTANVVLGAIAVADAHWVQALQHLASIVTFGVGAALATHLASRRRPRFAPTVEVLATVLLAVAVVLAALVPESAPPMVVTVPLVFLAAMLTELFGKAGELPYLPIATTGNLVRWVESTHEQVISPTSSSGRRFRVYLGLVGAFCLGALVGGLATDAVGVRAAPVAALPMALAGWLAFRGR